MVRTSLYANAATIFMAPNKDDINFLASTLHHFGDVTDLVTNCTKSQVAPITYVGLDLDHILQAFPTTRTNFPMKVLGLPLSVTSRSEHGQPGPD
jgi:hypothetical protein